jgi:3-hydroxybutyryl-CoA dehydratase
VEFDALRVGQFAEFSKTVTETDVVLYAGITGDFNPVHADAPAAQASRFGGRIAHGMLTAALSLPRAGDAPPRPGTIHPQQSLRFLAPVRIGDTVTARAVIVALIPEKRRVRLTTTCRTQAGDTAVEGEALAMVPAPARA